jgi:hypothetical protein
MNTEWRRRRGEIAGRSRHQSTEVSVTTVVLGLAVGALLAITTGLWCTRQLEEFGPSIGGIIVFKPDPVASERWIVDAIRPRAWLYQIASEWQRATLQTQPRHHGKIGRQLSH